MEQRIASNLLSLIRPEVERAQALLEAAQALQDILAQPQPNAPLPIGPPSSVVVTKAEPPATEPPA